MRTSTVIRTALPAPGIGGGDASRGRRTRRATAPASPEPETTKAETAGAHFLSARGKRHHQPAVRRRAARRNAQPSCSPIASSPRCRISPFHDLLSFDNGASIGIGLGYAPLHNLDLTLYRSSGGLPLDPSEIAGKYQFLSERPRRGRRSRGCRHPQRAQPDGSDDSFRAGHPRVHAILPHPHHRGADVHDQSRRRDADVQLQLLACLLSASERSLLRCQLLRQVSPAAGYLPKRVRRSPGRFDRPDPLDHRARRGDASPWAATTPAASGWVASIEKSLLRHRFCFTAGNQRQTTVDQYARRVVLGESLHEREGQQGQGRLPRGST